MPKFDATKCLLNVIDAQICCHENIIFRSNHVTLMLEKKPKFWFEEAGKLKVTEKFYFGGSWNVG